VTSVSTGHRQDINGSQGSQPERSCSLCPLGLTPLCGGYGDIDFFLAMFD
jgi:hypothetical protein